MSEAKSGNGIARGQADRGLYRCDQRRLPVSGRAELVVAFLCGHSIRLATVLWTGRSLGRCLSVRSACGPKPTWPPALPTSAFGSTS